LKDASNKMPKLIVEFAGVPASGKTTAANSLAAVLSKRGRRVEVVREAAESAPFSGDGKEKWQFNAWTLLDAVSQSLRLQCDSAADCVIFDRGLFDARCWLDWHMFGKRLDLKVFEVLDRFAGIPDWYGQVDVVFLLQADYRVALKRRNGVVGRIVNGPTFLSLEEAYDRVSQRHEEGPLLVPIDTAARNPSEVLDAVGAHLADFGK
jgi:predicted ATPase